MKRKFILGLLTGAFLFVMAGTAMAAFQVEIYKNYTGSTAKTALQAWTSSHTAASSSSASRIDFTNNSNWGQGFISGSQAFNGFTGRNSEGTQVGSAYFMAKITGSIDVVTAGSFFLRARADDVLYASIDGQSMISRTEWGDATSGAKYLGAGTHNIEFYFFQGGGLGQLEVTLAEGSGANFYHFDNHYALRGSGGPGSTTPEPATMFLFGFGLLGIAGVNRRKKKNNNCN